MSIEGLDEPSVSRWSREVSTTTFGCVSSKPRPWNLEYQNLEYENGNTVSFQKFNLDEWARFLGDLNFQRAFWKRTQATVLGC